MTNSGKNEGLTIGGLANAGGVGLGTIRYYQRIGLLASPLKPKNGGFRRYGLKDVERLHLIRNAQALGFSLKEIGEILKLREQSDCQSLRELIVSRQNAIRRRIEALENDLEKLSNLSSCCNQLCKLENVDDCPLIRSLVREKFQFAAD